MDDSEKLKQERLLKEIVYLESESVMVVGDLHLNSSTPKMRLDDYPTTTLNKLNQLHTRAVESGSKVVILLGDIFHQTQQSQTYLNEVAKVFKRFQDSGIIVFAIVGNHCVPYERLEYLDRTPLQSFFISGLIRNLNHLVLNGKYDFIGFDFPDKILPSSQVGAVGSKQFMFAHRFYEYALSDTSLTEKNIQN